MGKYDTCPVCGHLSVDFTGDNVDLDGAILVSAECWVCGASWIQRTESQAEIEESDDLLAFIHGFAL